MALTSHGRLGARDSKMISLVEIKTLIGVTEFPLRNWYLYIAAAKPLGRYNLFFCYPKIESTLISGHNVASHFLILEERPTKGRPVVPLLVTPPPFDLSGSYDFTFLGRNVNLWSVTSSIKNLTRTTYTYKEEIFLELGLKEYYAKTEPYHYLDDILL